MNYCGEKGGAAGGQSEFLSSSSCLVAVGGRSVVREFPARLRSRGGARAALAGAGHYWSVYAG